MSIGACFELQKMLTLVTILPQIPFNLCLRVWDVYLLDGEKVVTAMAYTILRLHKTKILKLKDMDLIVQYIQVSDLLRLVGSHLNFKFFAFCRLSCIPISATMMTSLSKRWKNAWRNCAKPVWICHRRLPKSNCRRNRSVCLSNQPSRLR